MARVLQGILVELGIKSKVSLPQPGPNLDHPPTQFLALSLDNASSNDTFTNWLKTLCAKWPGSANNVCCFAHTINLVAKSVLSIFDNSMKNKTSGFNMIPEENNLKDIKEGLEDEDQLASWNEDPDETQLDAEGDDNDDGLVDELEELELYDLPAADEL
jgi:hypothetical protein